MNDIRPCGNNEKWCENCVSKGKCDYTRSNMTRQEAIKNIKEHCYFANLNPKAKKALDFAVKTLEQEPCEDAISRQAAIEIARSNIYYNKKEDEYARELLQKTMAEISSLPPVTPKPKTDVFNKIRAEIKEVQTYKMFEGEDTVYVERNDVLAIIDKYKAESEVKNADSN